MDQTRSGAPREAATEATTMEADELRLAAGIETALPEKVMKKGKQGAGKAPCQECIGPRPESLSPQGCWACW
jgi:hypothetical protein